MAQPIRTLGKARRWLCGGSRPGLRFSLCPVPRLPRESAGTWVSRTGPVLAPGPAPLRRELQLSWGAALAVLGARQPGWFEKLLAGTQGATRAAPRYVRLEPSGVGSRRGPGACCPRVPRATASSRLHGGSPGPGLAPCLRVPSMPVPSLPAPSPPEPSFQPLAHSTAPRLPAAEPAWPQAAPETGLPVWGCPGRVSTPSRVC